jgi:hypothetical protein
MLANAFLHILSAASFPCRYERPGEVDCFEINVALSNYSRNRELPEETYLPGREFIIPAKELKATTFYPCKRGDRIISEDYGESVIREITELRGLKGEILGFRVRAE